MGISVELIVPINNVQHMMEIRRCTNGHVVYGQEIYCVTCGELVEDDVIDMTRHPNMYCPTCNLGNVYVQGEKFCSLHGDKLVINL